MTDLVWAPAAAGRIAILVMNPGSGATLCPFFSKCDGILVMDGRNGSKEYHHNGSKTSEAMCDLILSLLPDRLVCGFIGNAEKEKLRAAGVDVRLGSCACPVDELASCCCELPEA